MTNEFLQMAEQEGFEQGWSDALRGMPEFPRPDVGYELLQPGYGLRFLEAYERAYEAGLEEKQRRDALRRDEQPEHDHEEDRER